MLGRAPDSSPRSRWRSLTSRWHPFGVPVLAPGQLPNNWQRKQKRPSVGRTGRAPGTALGGSCRGGPSGGRR